MARTRAGWLRVVLAGLLAAAGCGSGKDDRRFAEELAGRMYPDALRVISVRSLFPQDAGSEISFALAGDADAVVRLRVDAAAGTCERQDCERKLAEAVAGARSHAAAWRLLAAAFERCGHPIVGVNWTLDGTWIEAAPTNATIAGLLAELGDCVRRWAAARDRAGSETAGKSGSLTAGKSGSLSIHLVAPEVARARPAEADRRPTLARLTDSRLLAALATRPYVVATFPAARGEPDRLFARIIRPYAEQQAFEKKVRQAVAARLAGAYPRAVVAGVSGLWPLEPGTVDRVTGHVLFCDEPPATRRCLGDHAVTVTTDPEGNLVGEYRVIRDVRDEQGVVRLPQE